MVEHHKQHRDPDGSTQVPVGGGTLHPLPPLPTVDPVSEQTLPDVLVGQNLPEAAAPSLTSASGRPAVIDRGSFERVEATRLAAHIQDLTISHSGKAFVGFHMEALSRNSGAIRARQAALAELRESPELLTAVQRLLRDAIPFEETRNSIVSQARFGGSYPDIRSTYLTMHAAVDALPTPTAPYLRTLVTNLQTFVNGPVGRLLDGPLGSLDGVLVNTKDMPTTFRMAHHWDSAPFTPHTLAILGSFAALGVSGALLKPHFEMAGLLALAFGSGGSLFTLFGGMFHKADRDRWMFYEPIWRIVESERTLQQFLVHLGILDELQALARFYNGAPQALHSQPTIIDSPHHVFRAKELRNPLYVAAGRNCTPNDVVIDADNLTVITGSNSCGKSFFCKTLIHNQILGLLGGNVFGQDVTLSLADSIFYQGPANNTSEDVEGQLGTELRAISAAIPHVTPRSLLIFDELGRGTNAPEGDAIADRAIRTTAAIGPSIVWVTHNLTMARSLMEQGAANALQGEYGPHGATRRLVPGVATTSHADAVAQRIGFPPQLDSLDAYLASLGKSRHTRGKP